MFTVLYCSANTLFPHHTVNPLFSANRWDWQPHWTLGAKYLVVLCAGSTLLLTPVVQPAISQPATPSELTFFSYWLIKPWFLTEGKLATVLIIPSSWGSPPTLQQPASFVLNLKALGFFLPWRCAHGWFRRSTKARTIGSKRRKGEGERGRPGSRSPRGCRRRAQEDLEQRGKDELIGD
jgi:hypothetical protein